jgi:hypothetical protein
MSNQAQNSNGKRVVLAFKHLGFNCHLDFDIWICLGFSAWDLGFGAEPLWGLGLVELDCHAWLVKNRVDPVFKGRGQLYAAPLRFHRQPSTSLTSLLSASLCGALKCIGY